VLFWVLFVGIFEVFGSQFFGLEIYLLNPWKPNKYDPNIYKTMTKIETAQHTKGFKSTISYQTMKYENQRKAPIKLPNKFPA
jgi:hypothetical protein